MVTGNDVTINKEAPTGIIETIADMDETTEFEPNVGEPILLLFDM